MPKLRSLMPSTVAIPRQDFSTQEREPKNAGRRDGGDSRHFERVAELVDAAPLKRRGRLAVECIQPRAMQVQVLPLSFTLRCSSCRREKSRDEFHADTKNKTHGLSTVCKSCKRARRTAEHRELQRGLALVRT
jgi:hypothetical protein